MATLEFNATTVAPQQTFTPLPAGTYPVMVTDSEVKPTKTGTGTMANFTLQVVDGEHRGRKIFARINVANANPEAERIGQSQLSALCHAAGVLQLSDTAQLHNKVVSARVKIRKDLSGQYGDQNEVSGFEAIGGATSAPQGFAPPTAQTAAAAAPAAPWKRQAA